MPQTQVSTDALNQLRTALKQAWNDIVDVKLKVDYYCYCFEWNDPVGKKFISRYEHDMAPVKESLLPAMDCYAAYLDKLGKQVIEYDETRNTSSLNPIIDGREDPNFQPYDSSHDSLNPNVDGREDSNFQPYDSSHDSQNPVVDGRDVSNLQNEAIAAGVGLGAVGVAAASVGLMGHQVPDEDFDERLKNMSDEDLAYQKNVYQEYSDYAQISEFSYHEGAPLPKGWSDACEADKNLADICSQLSKEGEASGYKFSLIKNDTTGKYVLAFGGTDFPKEKWGLITDSEFHKDALTDLKGAFDANEEQVKMAKKTVVNLVLKGKVPLDNIEFTGHSLGGRLAAEMSVAYARPATTFNAAGVSEETYKQYDFLMTHSKNNYLGIRNVVTQHDPLTNLQSLMSGAKNPYISALPKEKIQILHETMSNTLSSDSGKIAMSGLDVVPGLGTGTKHVIEGVDKAFAGAHTFNKYYNRDYRALGATLELPDGFNSTSSDAHRIANVGSLLRGRLEKISSRKN